MESFVITFLTLLCYELCSGKTMAIQMNTNL